MNRIAACFERQKPHEKIMSLFITAGYPRPEDTVELVLGLEKAGADIIELGMPFSDPLADGPTVQYASTQALSQGVTTASILDMVARIRERSQIPIVLMGYVNPVLAYGMESFFEDAAHAGADGLILPDVPPGAYAGMKELASKHGLALIHLVAPNTPDERMQLVDQQSEGFVYCVSVTGVTGVREGAELSNSVRQFIDRVKTHVVRNPVLVGFGIKSHKDAMEISAGLQGFIVGSALIDFIRNCADQPDWIDRTCTFVQELKYGK